MRFLQFFLNAKPEIHLIFLLCEMNSMPIIAATGITIEGNSGMLVPVPVPSVSDPVS